MNAVLVPKVRSAMGARGHAPPEVVKFRSFEFARNAYFYIYAQKGLLNLAV